METTNVSYTCEVVDNFLKITLKEDMKYNTLYSVTIPAAAVKDSAGNLLKKAYTFKYMSEVDPSKAAQSVSEEGYRYMLEIEAILKSELTPEQLTFFMQLLQKIGINAEIKDYYKVDEAGTPEGKASQDENMGKTSDGTAETDTNK